MITNTKFVNLFQVQSSNILKHKQTLASQIWLNIYTLYLFCGSYRNHYSVSIYDTCTNVIINICTQIYNLSIYIYMYKTYTVLYQHMYMAKMQNGMDNGLINRSDWPWVKFFRFTNVALFCSTRRDGNTNNSLIHHLQPCSQSLSKHDIMSLSLKTMLVIQTAYPSQ